MDDGRMLSNTPQCTPTDEPRQVARLLFGETEQFRGVGDLVGCLLEEDSGAGVAEQAGGERRSEAPPKSSMRRN